MNSICCPPVFGSLKHIKTTCKQGLRVIDETSRTTYPVLLVMDGDVSHHSRWAPSSVLGITYKVSFTKCVGIFLLQLVSWHQLSSPCVRGAPLNCLSVCQAFGQVPKVAARRFQSPWASPVFDMLHQMPHSRLCVHRPSYGTKTILHVL